MRNLSMPEAILRFAKIRGALRYHAVRGGHRPASDSGCLTYVGAEMLFGHVLLDVECFRFGLRSVAALT